MKQTWGADHHRNHDDTNNKQWTQRHTYHIKHVANDQIGNQTKYTPAARSDEGRTGKIRVPGGAGRVHIDRSGMGDVLQGSAANYAEWWLFGRAAAAVISRSYFGETAAEVIIRIYIE